MSMDWDGYEPYDAGIAAPLNTLPRAEARQAFKRGMETKPARIEMLRRLVKANGIELGTSDAAIQDLNDWFFTDIEPDAEAPGRPLVDWYSVIHDVALFLGEVMIERHPHLHWEFFTWGKRNVSFQRHVIMGMSTEDPKFRTNIDIYRMVSQYAHDIIDSRGPIPHYGTVYVRGVAIDVDAVAASHRRKEIETDAFSDWLRMVGQRA